MEASMGPCPPHAEYVTMERIGRVDVSSAPIEDGLILQGTGHETRGS